MPVISHPDHIARLLAHRRSLGLLAKRKRRLPRQQHPKPIQLDYAAAIIRMAVEPLRQGMAQLRRDLPQMLAKNPHAKQRRDDHDHDINHVRTTIKHLRASIQIPEHRIEETARTYARRTTDFQKAQLAPQLEAGYGMAVPIVDRHLQTRLSGFVANNVSLISNLPHEVVSDVEQTILRAFAAGDRWESLADDLDDRLDVGENRAKTIARDQISKLNGQVNADRQRELGIRKFIWRTVNDNRVRDECEESAAESEKEPYDYDDPPDGELPGVSRPGCRCYADPVIEMDDGSVEADDSGDDEGDNADERGDSIARRSKTRSVLRR